MRVNARNDALCCRFFVTGSAVNLAGQKEIIDHFRPQRIVKKLRVEIVVFYGISRLEEDRVL